MKCSPFCFNWLVVGGKNILASGSGPKFKCAALVGSGQTISGTGQVLASILSPCKPLTGVDEGAADKVQVISIQVIVRE